MAQQQTGGVRLPSPLQIDLENTEAPNYGHEDDKVR